VFFGGAYNNTNLSKNTDREKQLFSYIHEFSATDPEKALQELNPVMDLIPSGAFKIHHQHQETGRV